MDMRYEDDEEGNPFYYLLLAPSFSPEFGNNPGFTTLKVDDQQIHEVFFNFIDISKTIGQDTYDLSMDTFCPEFDLGVNNLYSPEGAKKLFQTIQNDEIQFLKWTER